MRQHSLMRSAVRHAARRQRERTFITRAGYNLAKKMMPKISETEQVSLGCGTVGFDREIFGGSPSLKALLNTYEAKLSPDERAFLDNEVNVLCRMIDDHKVRARSRRRYGSCLGPSQPRPPARSLRLTSRRAPPAALASLTPSGSPAAHPANSR
jgi:hypothetical protein